LAALTASSTALPLRQALGDIKFFEQFAKALAIFGEINRLG
jgi:hypothetical protein